LAADGVYLGGELGGGAGFGALEKHMFDGVCRAAQFYRLVAGTVPHPKDHGGAAGIRHLFMDDPRPVG
jgi:hypothetical protein